MGGEWDDRMVRADGEMEIYMVTLVPDIDEIEEKGVSGLDIEKLGTILILVLGGVKASVHAQMRMMLQWARVRRVNWEKP